MELFNLYARREPTTDAIIIKYAPKEARAKKDVAIYKDRACTEPQGRVYWHYKDRPHRNRKTIMRNCCKYNLIWLDDL